MSDSDRGKRSEAWLGLALAAAATIGGLIYWDASSREVASQIESENRAADYADTAWENVKPACFAAELSSEECFKKAEDSYRPQQRDEYDLAAQQTMAAWTRAMGLAALVGMGVGIFGLGLIWRTWDATREAAENSGRTLRSFIAKERARLKPLRLAWGHGGENQTKNGAYLLVANIGPSAATIVFCEWRIDDEPRWSDHGFQVSHDRVVIASGGEESTPFIELPESKDVAFLSGRIEYETLEQERFRTHFAYKCTQIDNYGDVAWTGEWLKLDEMPKDT